MMPGKHFSLAVLLLALLAQQSAAEHSDQFLQALVGDWVGRAELTPIGPRGYDIRFSRDQDGSISGSTGEATIHHWTFFREEDLVTIRFLSTFAGNREPILLYEVSRDEKGILFRARDPELLSVKVSIPSKQLSIDVFHWDQPHVSIRLSRSENKI